MCTDAAAERKMLSKTIKAVIKYNGFIEIKFNLYAFPLKWNIYANCIPCLMMNSGLMRKNWPKDIEKSAMRENTKKIPLHFMIK